MHQAFKDQGWEVNKKMLKIKKRKKKSKIFLQKDMQLSLVDETFAKTHANSDFCPPPQRSPSITSSTPGSPSVTWTAARKGQATVTTTKLGWKWTDRRKPQGRTPLPRAVTPPASPAPAPAPPVSTHHMHFLHLLQWKKQQLTLTQEPVMYFTSQNDAGQSYYLSITCS